MGHPKGCLLAGMYSYTDWKDEKANALKNKAQSAPYLSKACDLGQHLGCARFGELNIQGEHVPVWQFISSYLMVLFLKNSLDMIRLLKKMEFITKIFIFLHIVFF